MTGSSSVSNNTTPNCLGELMLNSSRPLREYYLLVNLIFLGFLTAFVLSH